MRSAAAALGALGALAALCFGLQAATLGRPGNAEIELVHTLAVLRAHAGSGAQAVMPPGPASSSICGPERVRLDKCPLAVERWFGRELARGAPIVRLPVDLGGHEWFALRVPKSRPPIEIVVKGGGAPIGLALGAQRERSGVLR